MQTEIQCLWWVAKLGAGSPDQGDKTSKSREVRAGHNSQSEEEMRKNNRHTSEKVEKRHESLSCYAPSPRSHCKTTAISDLALLKIL